MKCSLCPRQCKAERTETENQNGYCKMPLLPRAARAALHFWEEPCISGTNGSGTVFFSGCSLHCIYCQNGQISHGGEGVTVSVERLAEIFRELEQKGAHNINLVNPTHYALAIRDALRLYRPAIPIVYNSGGYDRVETLRMLASYIDIYLMDLKYISSAVAAAYSDAADYPEVAKAAILECCRQQPDCVFDDKGLMRRGVILRHLILPQGTNEAIGVIEWAREHTPNACFSLMSQYFPCGAAKEHKVLNRRITAREYDKVLAHLYDAPFPQCLIQQRSSAAEEYVPPFNGEGLRAFIRRD